MIKRYLSKAFAVLAAALAISSCGMMASAAQTDMTAALSMQTMAETDITADENGNIYYGEDDQYVYSVDDQGEIVKTEKKNWVKIILVALVISGLATGITVFIIYRGYKYNGMTEPYEFKNKAPLSLTEKEDMLIDVHVTSRHINRDNN